MTTYRITDTIFTRIANAIRRITGGSAGLKPREMATALEDTSVVKTSGATAAAGDILSGKTAYVNGAVVTGNIPTNAVATPAISVDATGENVNIQASVTQAAGYTAGGTKNTSNASIAIYNAQTVTPDNTSHTYPTNEKYVKGNFVVNAIPDSYVDVSDIGQTALQVSGKTVTAPAGYYSDSVSADVQSTTQATPSISVAQNGLITATSTQSEGYVAGGTKSATQQLTVQTEITKVEQSIKAAAGYYPEEVTYPLTAAWHIAPEVSVDSTTGLITASHYMQEGWVENPGSLEATQQLTTQSAQTITPGVVEQTIAAGRYLTGTQTIAGDADLVPGNIKNGVTIFNVAGTYAAQVFRTGTSEPINSLGNNGDLYLVLEG